MKNFLKAYKQNIEGLYIPDITIFVPLVSGILSLFLVILILIVKSYMYLRLAAKMCMEQTFVEYIEISELLQTSFILMISFTIITTTMLGVRAFPEQYFPTIKIPNVIERIENYIVYNKTINSISSFFIMVYVVLVGGAFIILITWWIFFADPCEVYLNQ